MEAEMRDCRRRPVGTASWAALAAWGVSALVALAFPACAQTESPADFYKGKTVKIIVGFGVGGGYDTYARMLAPYLREQLKTTVIVENQPGAGGLSALNRLYAAPPDGLQLMLISGIAATLSQLIEQPEVRYDLSKVGHLGIVSASPWMWVGNTQSAIKRAPDAMKPGVQLSWGASGQIDGTADGAAITCTVLKLDCKVIGGYRGTAEVALAIERKEMDALYVSDTSANLYIRSGQVRPVATMARTKSRFFPDAPTIFESAKLTPEQEWWFDFRATLDALGRVLITPPGIAADRLAVLQEAVKAMVRNPTLLAEAEKTQRYIDYRDPAASLAAIERVIKAPTAAQRAEIKHIVLSKY
jgi:tripartite-type tricarboxylate transporter receptor subunit TctC